MTAPIPLTGNALEIQRRLDAGQTVDHVTEVGRWRRSWQREDVLAVACELLHRCREQEAENDRIASAEHLHAVIRPECGTPAGAQKHVRGHERLCEPCRIARNKYQNQRRRKTA